MIDTDCLVLGLGAMGSATLYHLARMNVNVVGIEQFETGHANGSSHGHSRAFRVFYRDPLYTELAEAAWPLWRDLQVATGESLLHECGFVAWARPGNTLFERNLSAIRQSTVDFELLAADEISARFPSLRIPDSATACFTPKAGFLDADRCVRAHLSEALKNGASIHERVRVESIEPAKDAVVLRTSNGDFRARRLVTTAGPWTADLWKSLNLPLTVTRQQKFYFQVTCPDSLQADSLPVYADYDTRYYGFPFHGPGLKVADDTRGSSTHPDRIDRNVDHREGGLLRAWLETIMPHHSFDFLEASTCMYTETPDQDFLIGVHPVHPGILIGGGFSGHGFKFSTLIGLILSQLALDGSTPYPIQRFSPDRFSKAD